jgi:hypothetical protein
MRPVVMEIQSISRSGEWIRRVSFPAYPDCAAESESMEEGISLAYRRLVERLAAAGTGEEAPATAPAPRRLRDDLAPVIELYRSLDS